MTLIGTLSSGGFWSTLALLMHAFLMLNSGMLNSGRPQSNRFGSVAGTPAAT